MYFHLMGILSSQSNKGPVIIYVGGGGEFFSFSVKEKTLPTPLTPLVNS